jgi:hypothetical protein
MAKESVSGLAGDGFPGWNRARLHGSSRRHLPDSRIRSESTSERRRTPDWGGGDSVGTETSQATLVSFAGFAAIGKAERTAFESRLKRMPASWWRRK